MNKNEIFVTFAKQKFDEKYGKLTDEITIDFIWKQLDSFIVSLMNSKDIIKWANLKLQNKMF